MWILIWTNQNLYFPNNYKQTPLTTAANPRAVYHPSMRLKGGMAPLHVIPARRSARVGCWVAWRLPWVLGGAAAAEEGASYDDETRSAPSHVQSTSKFKPVNDAHVIFYTLVNMEKIYHCLHHYSRVNYINMNICRISVYRKTINIRICFFYVCTLNIKLYDH